MGPEALDILADPQTSGGLLMAVSRKNLESLLTLLGEKGASGWVIGRVADSPPGRLRVIRS